ncbi:hypothetical protein DNU06_07900 [Putridiphycobacter roseus]|uniref:PKD domain-containing protein n=1 Tax=Putridiphycobacter roseus TaxID=2219161 RepID=A0A2W1MZ58_9FLAO|nr:PKD domain-containing protein [Putridiphycobacter roseus]PZE17187.1 hypothetical protein DNU06_07900 [Putridiphycobacter roseus]
MKKISAILYFTFITFVTFAQNQIPACQSPAIADGHWYFGYKNGLDFSSGTPVYDNAPNIHNVMASGTQESIAIQNDQNGNMLFYTDGYKLYDQNHWAITGFFGGHASSAAGSIIVPNPAQSNQYYVFNTGVQNTVAPVASVFSYTIVTVTGTQAAVTPATTYVTVPAPAGYFIDINNGLHCAEGVTAVAGCDNSYYIITTGRKAVSDHFMVVFKLDNSGLNFHSEKAIPGILSATVQGDYAIPIEAAPNGEKVAINPFRDGNVCRVFDFNNMTGILSNEAIINHEFYSVCFSPDSKLLYGSINSSDILYQYNAQAVNIAASEMQVGPFTDLNGYSEDMERGPDDKIYINRRKVNLAVIHNPNNPVTASNMNACNLDDNGPLLQHYASTGLPNVFDANKAHVFPSTNISGVLKTCISNSGNENYAVSLNSGETVSWTLTGGNFIGGSNQANITVDWASLPGTLTVNVNNEDGCTSSQTITVTECCDIAACVCNLIPTLNYSISRSCEVEFTGTSGADPCLEDVTYAWDFGDGTTFNGQNPPLHIFPSSGDYTICLTVTGSNGVEVCTKSICKTIHIRCNPPCDCKGFEPVFKYDLNKENCTYSFDAYTDLDPCFNNVSYSWNFGDNTTSIGESVGHVFGNSGTYYVCLTVEVKNDEGEVICKNEYCKKVEVKCKGECECKLDPYFDLTIGSDCNYIFTGFSGSNCVDVNAYEWYVNGTGPISSQVMQQQFINGETYEICLVVKGSTADSQCEEKICKKITADDCGRNVQKSSAAVNDLTLFPNPANASFQFSIKAEKQSEVQVYLKGLNGQVLSSYTELIEMGTQNVKIDLPAIANGLFLVEIILDDQHYVKRIVIQQ